MNSKMGLGRATGSVVLCAAIAALAQHALAGSVLVRYTNAGDSNLDGTVNAADFTSLATNYNASGLWTEGDFNYDGQVNAMDFNAVATNFGASSTITAPSLSSYLPVDSYRSTLYTAATVRFDGHRRNDQELNIETAWLPHVLAAQQAQAGVKLSTEALKALAVADRSLLYYTLGAKGWITSGHGAPDCDLSLTPTKSMKTAATFTEREYLQFDNAPLIGYAVDGDKKTDQYVTDNFNLSGGSVQPTSLGSTKTLANRGALSITDAERLAEKGANYVDILQRYYGSDAQLALGTYKFMASAYSAGSTPPAPAGVKLLSNFEHDDGLLGPAATKHVTQTNVRDSSIQMNNQGLDSSHAEQITIDYDEKHAKSAPFTFRALTGAQINKGTTQANMILPSTGELGFMIRTKTRGLSTQILVNDHADGAIEKSAARDIISDGHWHLYSWQINSAHGWKNFVKGKGDNLVTGAFTLNSILVNGKSDASLSLDDVSYEEYPNDGSKVQHLSYKHNDSSDAAIFNPSLVGYSQMQTAVNYGMGTVIVDNTTAAGTLLTGVTTINSDLTIHGWNWPYYNLGTGTLTVSNPGNILGGGSVAFGGASSIGTLTTSTGTAFVPGTGSIQFADGGSLSTITGGLSNYAIGPGTELSHLDNGALLLSGGTFGTGGLLLLNNGSLSLSDASVAPQFVELQQPSGLIATVLVPEPATVAAIALAAMALSRRRRRQSSN